jgi:hypothetical protein
MVSPYAGYGSLIYICKEQKNPLSKDKAYTST